MEYSILSVACMKERTKLFLYYARAVPKFPIAWQGRENEHMAGRTEVHKV